MALLLAIGVLVVTPSVASAHAFLIGSQPADGAQLGLAPAAVVLDFSENLNPTLSEATVSESSSRPVESRPIAAREIRVDLVTNAPGLYRVQWVAVSAEDGHTTQGTLTFTVEARASGAQSSGSAMGPSATDVGIALARWVEDAALLVAVGMLFLTWLARRDDELAWVRPRLRPPLVVALAAGCVVVGSEAAVASGGTLSGVIVYFGSGLTGVARIARVVLELNAVAAVTVRARYLAPAVAAPLVALAASGHAAGNGPAALGIGLDSLHLLAAGVWAGGIIAMATLRPPQGWHSAGRLLRRFTPWAVAAFSVTVSAGIVQAVLDVGNLSALTGSLYGRVLIAKAAAVTMMVPLSVVAWRVRRPRPRAEAALAVAVIAASALLASSPVPARGLAESPTGAPGAAAGLPHGSDLTMGASAGQVLVGLTITPARPGANTLTLYVLPLEGASAAAGLHVVATVDGNSMAVSPCGDPCRRGTAGLRGGERIGVEVVGAHGGIAAFTVPPLPAPDGAALVRRAATALHAVRSYAMHETLTSGGSTTVVTDYQAMAPDRLEWVEATGVATISIGTTRYDRDGPGGAWTRQDGSPSIAEPQYVWDAFTPYLGIHVFGEEAVDGTATTVVGFFGGDASTPVWFRLWIDAVGLVHRAEMRAPGHFMDETFTEFNSAPVVTPPPG
jgi:copper transport protein